MAPGDAAPSDLNPVVRPPLERLEAMLTEILPRQRFYADKFRQAGVTARSALTALPFTEKAELLANQRDHPPFGQLLTYPLESYSRLHQTSGTSGSPLRWLDTPTSWSWLLDCWQTIFRLIGLRREDRLFFPFSFGPFLGFWSAFESACRSGYLCIPGGGMSSSARLHLLLENSVTVVLCTPTYALHLLEVAAQEKLELAHSPVRLLIVAGEPGGSIPSVRQKLETGWGARVCDHTGLTEVGPLASECAEQPGGLHLLENDYLVEVLAPGTPTAVQVGEVGELVVTNLGRWGSPLIRYRTGDLVRLEAKPCPCGYTGRRLSGGVLGRTDDMLHLRGNNVYPSAIEAVVRSFPEIVEYRLTVKQRAGLAELTIELEPTPGLVSNDLAERLAQAIRDQLLFRAEVVLVPTGSLPRFEMKAKRLRRS